MKKQKLISLNEDVYSHVQLQPRSFNFSLWAETLYRKEFMSNVIFIKPEDIKKPEGEIKKCEETHEVCGDECVQ